METASTMHSSREESAQPSPTAPLDLPRAVHTQPALQVTAPNLPMAPMGPDGLPNLLAGIWEWRGADVGVWDVLFGCGETTKEGVPVFFLFAYIFETFKRWFIFSVTGTNY